ncbi:uncharacterized protein proca1 [Mugil cephalus]|uniref:uncharacterized protein proca1 n=1 Tax=Mugil cephalus TaxID=48193 RepID=UPI001FB5DA04|nr:uncharacterized protein proca1 [Mugil cephalus]
MWSVFFVFLSYLDRNFVKGDFLNPALDAEKESKEMFSMLNGTFCAKMSIVGENFLYQVSDGAEVVRSVVSPTGKLVNCSIIVNQMQVKSFMQECRLGLKDQRASGGQLETHFARMDEAKLMCREFKERSERNDMVNNDVREEKVLKRSKRGFTYPGTLWCGAGNMADNYDQLGEFPDTDSCCRTHDHCAHVIHAFSSNYGYTNFKWYPICHCDCDNALKDCLRKVNDTSSRVVGQAFFNVIGVPCFEFAYEEQCAERHWYGMCKRYEKFPVAVLQEAVPYDYGGIDVIDKLTWAPPKSKDSKKSSEEEKPESPTKSTVSSPEEPSLRNVVTAAEDFIKVLATVSTSQSSTADSDKDEAQSSEKKKRKNADKKKKKKTNKKQKGKGKGSKRKQKAEAGVRGVEEGAVVSPSGSKAVLALSNFINESHKHDQPSRNTNRGGDREYELGGKDEPSNEVMKDEPVMDKDVVSVTSPTTVQKRPADADVLPRETALSTSTTTPHKTKKKQKGQRKERKRKNKKTHLLSFEEVAANTTDDLEADSVPAIIIITPMAEPKQQRRGNDAENRPDASIAATPFVIPKDKRSRSKERGGRVGRKKRRKASSPPSFVPVDQQNSSVDDLKVIPATGTSTITLVPTTEPQLSDIFREKVQITALNSSFSVLQRSKVRRLRNKRRKAVVPHSSENTLFSYNSTENMISVLTTPDTALNHPASWVTQVPETHSEWKLLTTVAPTVSTKRHLQTARQHRKPRKKAVALSDAIPFPKQTKQVTFTTSPANLATSVMLRSEKAQLTTSAAPVMSPLRLSIERARAQFSRKKRRKAALSNRQP